MIRLLVLTIIISNTYALTAKEEKVLKTVKRLGMSLKKELKSSMKSGPSNALNTCHLKAPKITESVTSKEVQVGRVSLRNRNPNNTPKKWMRSYISDFHAKKVNSKYIFVDITKNKRGFLMPIKTGGLCLKCHGTNISKTLQGEISKRYPQDKATGYKAGEIRGFFWAEFLK